MKNIAFTTYASNLINMPKEEWNALCEKNTKRICYIIFQQEICPKTGKVHIQGYCELHRSIPMKTIKNMFMDQTMHIEKRKGNQTVNIDYCSKPESSIEGSQYEWGTPFEDNQGKRTDIDYYYELRRDPNISAREAADACPTQFMRYYKAGNERREMELDHMANKSLKQRMAKVVLSDWQLQFIELLKQPINRRTVMWIADDTGLQGKTILADWCKVYMNAQILPNGKTADIAQAYERKPIVFIDMKRTQQEYVNYNVIEQIKDGRIWNPKWASHFKPFDSPHLVILANWWPDLKALSKDRWFIWELVDGGLIHKQEKDWPLFENSTFKGLIPFN